MKLETRGMELNIKEGHAVAFDFDGVRDMCRHVKISEEK